ncbi:MAG TPA: glycosyltransferase [Sediminibacterium sp.]|nr:glycosyltransferase [Sediminibacterium sp.]
MFKKKGLSQQHSKSNPDYAIIVTAYEQTHTLGPVVASLLQLKYKQFLVYIVADKCDISQLHFEDPRIIVLRPEETLSSNTRSHFYAIHRFVRPHDRLTIIDSDNLVEPDYLDQLNPYFDAGFKAVQGVRDAKNMDTMYACLDAARDIYYHFYDGKILFQAGSSATLAGSGMAFNTELYRTCLEHQDITGAGFDKILQKEIVNRGERIAFSEHAIVYDEKTSKSE